MDPQINRNIHLPVLEDVLVRLSCDALPLVAHHAGRRVDLHRPPLAVLEPAAGPAQVEGAAAAAAAAAAVPAAEAAAVAVRGQG